MIEDGNADFERIQHTHAVNLGENIGDHVGFGVDVEQLADGVVILGGILRKVAAHNIARIVAAVQYVAKIVREKRSITFESGQERKTVDVALLPGQRNIVAEFAALHAVGQEREDLVAIKFAGPSGKVFEDAAAGVNAVTIVSGKHLVAAIARKGHSDMLASHLRNVVSGQHGGVAERLFERTGEMLDGLDDVGLKNHFVMIGGEFLGDDTRVVGFVEIVFLEADGESLDRSGTGTRHQRNHGRGISAAAEESTERHIGDQANFCGFKETLF